MSAIGHCVHFASLDSGPGNRTTRHVDAGRDSLAANGVVVVEVGVVGVVGVVDHGILYSAYFSIRCTTSGSN